MSELPLLRHQALQVVADRHLASISSLVADIDNQLVSLLREQDQDLEREKQSVELTHNWKARLSEWTSEARQVHLDHIHDQIRLQNNIVHLDRRIEKLELQGLLLLSLPCILKVLAKPPAPVV